MSEINVDRVREILDKLFAQEKLFPTEKSTLAEWFVSGALKVDRHVKITGNVQYSNIITGDGNTVIYTVEGLPPETVDTKIEQGYESILDIMIGIPGLERILQSKGEESGDIFKYNKWREADEKTQAVMVKIADRDFGNDRYGPRLAEWDFTNSSLTLPCKQLNKVDKLWRRYSNERFGFSVQYKIWKEVNGNFKEFGTRVGWRRKKGLADWRTLSRWNNQYTLTYNLGAPCGHLPVWWFWDGGEGLLGLGLNAQDEPLLNFGRIEGRIRRFFSYIEKDCKALLNEQ